ncbi:MAG: hypothetical protein COB15_03275 [Flavobacteriales bacterium]|nr:MAG: hypothetical protein COB15_03275 [Flavobacteriales bacterium]
MKKLAIVLIGTILSLSLFSQSPHDVRGEYVINGEDTTEVYMSFDYITLDFGGKGLTIRFKHTVTGLKQKIKMDIVSCDTYHYLSHHAIFYLDSKEYGKMILEEDDDAYTYRLYTEVDGLGNFHKLILF